MEGEIDVGTVAVPLQQWQLILGFLLPLLIAFLLKSTWPRWLKSLVMVIVSFLATAVTMYLNGQLDNVSAQTYVAKALEVVVATIAFYVGVWHPTNVAPTIESKTTIPVLHA
jgi:CHASE2 domain-containing sensor protein